MDKRDLAITTPCTLDWKKMTPAEGGRFCGDCKKVVKDLSKMTEAEARALLAKSRNQDLCVRAIHDARGQIFFADSQRLVNASLLNKAKRAAAAAAALAMPFAMQACTLTDSLSSSAPDEPTDQYDHVMGGIAADPNQKTPDLEPPDGSADAAADATPTDTDGGDAGADAAPDARPDAEGPN